MPPNSKNAVEEPERSWPENGSASFIDIDLNLDMVTNNKHGRRSSSSHRPKAKETGKGNAWAEANELQSNLHVEIGDRSFHLHKFPLISKSGNLNRLVFELRDPNKDRIALHDIPGGAEAFENAVRFLYGKTVPLTSANVAALRCAAEFLEMNDTLGDGSLVAMTEHYLNLVVVGSWKDSIAVLRSCPDLMPWADDLEIVRRCSESVAWKASTDPHGLRWSYSKTTGSRDRDRDSAPPRSWWFDDVCSLNIDTFSKVINAVVAKGMDSAMVAAVVVHYGEKWLGLAKETKEDSHSSVVAFTGGFNHDVASKAQIKNRAILQGIVSLLPVQSKSVSCKFLLKILRAACAVSAGPMCKTDLARRIATQLEKVSVDELLIPAYSAASDAMYDIDVAHQIVEFYLQEQSSGSPPVSPTSTSSSSASAASSKSNLTTSSITSASITSASITSVTTSSTTSATDTTSSISGRSSVSRTSISSSSDSRTSISGMSITGSSITRTTSGASESGSDESSATARTSTSATSVSSSEESVKLDNKFGRKFFSTEGPTRRPQLAPTTANLRVARLLESYLEEVAKDSSIPLGKFVALADLFIEFPRESDDCVYRAIDTFLRSHPGLREQECRKLCRVMDIQALSLNACMHAASNERLPLRVVVQVLFTEQVKLRNAITGTAVINDKGVDSIPASFSSSSTSRDFSLSSSDPLSSSSASTSTDTSSTTGRVTSSSAYSLSIHSAAPSVAPSAGPSAVSSLMPGGLNVKDTLRAALSEIELLRTAVQEMEMVKARLGFMDVLQLEMENINRKFMDLAHDYTGMTHQVMHDVEEMTKASKHKSGWTSGWKKMAKPFHSKDHPDLHKGYNHTLASEKHLKAAQDTIPLYHHMSILHPTDVSLLQNPAKAPMEPPKALAAPGPALRVSEPAKVATPLPKVEAPKAEAVAQVQQTAALDASLKPNGTLNGALDQALDRASDQAPLKQSVSSSKGEKTTAAEIPVDHKESSSHHQKYPKTPDNRGHQPRSQHRALSPDPHHGRHHVKDSDTVSVSSDSSYSSTHSNPRHRHGDTSSGHRHHHNRDGFEDHYHRSSSHGQGGHRSHHHNRHRDGSTEERHGHGSSHYYRDRSPDERPYHRGHHSPDRSKDHHHSNSKETSRPGSASNHKQHGSDHHSGHSGHHGHHSKPHHRGHHKHSHKKDYDSASNYSSDSASRPARPRRHSGV